MHRGTLARNELETVDCAEDFGAHITRWRKVNNMSAPPNRRLAVTSVARPITEVTVYLHEGPGDRRRLPADGRPSSRIISDVAAQVREWPNVARTIGIPENQFEEMSAGFDEEQLALAESLPRK